jgi:phage terminase large subunit
MSGTETTTGRDARPYEPFGAARKLFYSEDREVLIDGPAGTGKTRACLEKVHLLAQEIPDLRVLLVRKTRASMTQSILVTFEEKVLPADSPVKSGPKRWYRQNYRYPNGAEVVIGGLDSVERIMSSEYDIIVVFEATETTENEWETLLSRLRNHVLTFQQAIADCNPSHPRHWLIERARSGKMTRFPSRHEDNPSLKSEYVDALSQLSGHRRSRLYEGVWAAAEGLVYPDADKCIAAHFDPPAGRLVGGIDFGWTNPFAALGGTVYSDDAGRGIVYVWYERYLTKTLALAGAAFGARVVRGPFGTAADRGTAKGGAPHPAGGQRHHRRDKRRQCAHGRGGACRVTAVPGASFGVGGVPLRRLGYERTSRRRV